MIYLLPVPIDIHEETRALPLWTIDVTHSLNVFIVERARTARRYLKSIGHPTPISEIRIFEMDKHDNYSVSQEALELFNKVDIGILSESGLPGVADPGHHIILYAHQNDVAVTSLPGPSSIVMALQCSGLNGQHFEFIGYLDNKDPMKHLKGLELSSLKESKTIIFIETPYRNIKTFNMAIRKLSEKSALCIASGISTDSEWIKTKSIGEWKKSKIPPIDKVPTVFVLQTV